jgi:hypothetical protein
VSKFLRRPKVWNNSRSGNQSGVLT